MSDAKTVRNREVLDAKLAYAALLLIAVVIFYARGWFFLTGEIRAVISNVPDDTGYFYKIAWNVVQGKGLTFDGINYTNGFQPLWLYLLLPLAWIMRDATPEAYFRAALLYQTLIVVFSGLLLFYAIKQIASYSVALVPTTLFYFFSRTHFINGMETGVLVLCLSLLLAYTLRRRAFCRPDARIAVGFGLLAGLLLLARLDMVFLIGIVYAAIVARVITLRRNRAEASGLIRDILISLLSLTIVVAPYFAYNKLTFGAVMPISGKLKNSFPAVVQPEFGLDRFGSRDLLAVGVAVGFCLWMFLSRRLWSVSPEGQRYYYTATLIGSLATIAHYVNTALFMKWAVFKWHFAFYHFTFCLVGGALILQVLQGRRVRGDRLIAFGVVAFVLLAAGRTLLNTGEQYSRHSWRSIAYDAALWARQNTPPDAVFAMKDAGIFGLFSQRAVINLDGLVNDMAYQEALRRRQLNQYFAEKGVQYLVQHAMWDEAERNRVALTGKYEYIEMAYRSQLYGNWSDPVRLYRSDEVFRSQPYHDGSYETVFLIWRLPHSPRNNSQEPR